VQDSLLISLATAQDREDMSEDDEDSDEDVNMDSEGEDEAVDIRALVGGQSRNKRAKETSTSGSPPPSSKMRT